jgi:hypothetical protein
MDIRDKHREIALSVYVVRLNVSGQAMIPAMGYFVPWEIKPRAIRPVGFPQDVQMKAKLSVDVTLSEFSGRGDSPLVPTLQDLLRFTRNAVESFTEEFA